VIGPPVERRNVVSSASVSVFGTASTGPVVGGVNGFGTITARIAAMSFACPHDPHQLPPVIAHVAWLPPSIVIRCRRRAHASRSFSRCSSVNVGRSSGAHSALHRAYGFHSVAMLPFPSPRGPAASLG
jgi:hypothetical protein